MATGTYRINDTDLFIQPTYGRWLNRELIDVDGNGHPVYSPYYSFEMQWNLSSMDEIHQLQDFFDALGRTGTASIDLPRYAYDPYTFRTYSGTVLQEPTYDNYYSEHLTNVTLMITKIRVT